MSFDSNQNSYLALRNQVAERTRPVVAWIGAGLSAQAGMPTWQGLKQVLVQAGLDKARSMEKVDRARLEGRINSAVREENMWLAFGLLKEIVGATTYHDEIRRALGEAPRVKLPDVYKDIWKLPIRGVLNLNIDRLVTRAFAECRPEALPHEFTAEQMAGMTHTLTSIRPFIANVHGTVEQAGTWVFTHKDLAVLQRNTGYSNFIRTCISMNSVLFLGISADDLAVGGHLDWFKKNKIETTPHFWLTDRRDAKTDQWAEDAGIRVIRYSSVGGDHRGVAEFFEDLLSHIPEEDSRVLVPVVSKSLPKSKISLPDPETLSRQTTDEIRSVLNLRARELLEIPSAASYDQYERFCNEYDEAIHRAWYVSAATGRNNLLGYTIEETVARGAFGQVFRARADDGSSVAIKLLHEEIRSNADLLRSFRRGVRSMAILQKSGVRGMVEYRDASEIPAFVAMEWIDGPNLTEATKGKHIDAWEEILQVGRDLSRIINAAHRLPERVLHRDLRPANIMLKGFWESPQEWELVVLDFDLSWHRGAMERSVLHSTAMGYLAPEQYENRPGVSTRHAAVDSYGFGMTFFFACTGIEPIAGQHRHADWLSMLYREVGRRRSNDWRSLPTRVARLIEMATQDEQSMRLDMGQIEAELSLLYDAATNPAAVQSLELISEEIAARAESISTYKWNADRGVALYKGASGLEVSLSGDETNKTVEVALQWERTGTEDRKRLAQNVGTAVDRVSQKLRAGGWRIGRVEPRTGGFLVEGTVDRQEALRGLAILGKAIDGACEQVRMT